MLNGYTLPRTPRGTSCLAPAPPWHYAGQALAVEFEANEAAARALLPDGLELASPQCAVYFAEWQYASEGGEEYLDPVRSQYHETMFLLSASYEGFPATFCPFIWVDQDVSLMRGLIQGWPKQMGATWITRAYEVLSRATPVVGPGGRFGATLSAKERRLAEARVTLDKPTVALPVPNFSRIILTRYFPSLAPGEHNRPAVHELVQLKARDVQVSTIWKGEAELHLYDHPYLELPELRPTKVLAGYRFGFAFTVDELLPLRNLQQETTA